MVVLICRVDTRHVVRDEEGAYPPVLVDGVASGAGSEAEAYSAGCASLGEAGDGEDAPAAVMGAITHSLSRGRARGDRRLPAQQHPAGRERFAAVHLRNAGNRQDGDGSRGD